MRLLMSMLLLRVKRLFYFLKKYFGADYARADSYARNSNFASFSTHKLPLKTLTLIKISFKLLNILIKVSSLLNLENKKKNECLCSSYCPVYTKQNLF